MNALYKYSSLLYKTYSLVNNAIFTAYMQTCDMTQSG